MLYSRRLRFTGQGIYAPFSNCLIIFSFSEEKRGVTYPQRRDVLVEEKKKKIYERTFRVDDILCTFISAASIHYAGIV